MTTDVEKLVKSCDEMIEACGKFPRNVPLSKYHHFLGEEWGTVFRKYYTEHPKARLGVSDGFEMAVPVLENTIKELNEPSDPSQSSPAS
jgi:hypothetical protein